MLLRSFPLTLLLSTLALSSPLQPRQNTTLPTLYVSEFYAFMADPSVDGAQSNLSFRVTDLRNEYFSSAICEISNTYFHLFAISALFDYCGERNNGWMYSYNEGGLTVRKGWYEGNSYVQGTGNVRPIWVETGPDANVTVYPTGKAYERKEDWPIPVQSVQAAAPPS